MGYSSRHHGATGAGAAGTLSDADENDPALLDPLLNQLVVIIQRAEMYNRFMGRRASKALEAASSAPEWAQKVHAELTHSGDLQRKVQELAGYYILLEESFMKRSVHKVRLIRAVSTQVCILSIAFGAARLLRGTHWMQISTHLALWTTRFLCSSIVHNGP